MAPDVWVEKLQRGDEEAFGALYQSYAPGLLRHLLGMLGNTQEAEEMLHEVMMLMLQKIGHYTPRPDLKNSFKAWLWRLATHRAIDEIRKRKGSMLEWGEEVVSAEDIEAEYEKREQEGLIGELLQQLPLMQRMVLGLRVNDDLSYLEISAVIGRDVNTVKQGLFHARKRMKELLLQKGEWA